MLDLLFYAFMAITAVGAIKFALQVRAARIKAITDAQRAHFVAMMNEAKRLQAVARECRAAGDHDGAMLCHQQSDEIYRQRLGTLRSVDDMIQSLFNVLEETNQINNTYFFYTG